MPVTGRRFAIVALMTASLLRADAHQEIVDTFASMTSALIEDEPDAAGFMRPIEKSMPGYLELDREIKALLQDWVPSSSLDFISDEGDDTKRKVDIDWYLELQGRQEGGPTKSRRETIRCELVKQGKRWRIVSLQPISFFKP